jgi:predicted secreted protein
MGIFSSIVVFVCVWWVVLFTVLPWGVRSQQESGDVEAGTEPGAPVRHGLGRKMAITTGIAVVIWLIFFVVINTGILAGVV